MYQQHLSLSLSIYIYIYTYISMDTRGSQRHANAIRLSKREGHMMSGIHSIIIIMIILILLLIIMILLLL